MFGQVRQPNVELNSMFGIFSDRVLWRKWCGIFLWGKKNKLTLRDGYELRSFRLEVQRSAPLSQLHLLQSVTYFTIGLQLLLYSEAHSKSVSELIVHSKLIEINHWLRLYGAWLNACWQITYSCTLWPLLWTWATINLLVVVRQINLAGWAALALQDDGVGAVVLGAQDRFAGDATSENLG